MTAYDLLKKLMAMVEGTDFNRCSAARAFKGTYDVFVSNHVDDLMFLEHEEDTRRQTEAPTLDTAVVSQSPVTASLEALVPLDEFLNLGAPTSDS